MKIRDKLPKREPRRLAQAKIPQDLYNRVNRMRAKDDLTWSELIIACLHSYAEETRAGK